MNKAFMKILTNPIKCKLLFEIQNCGTTTTKHLSETFSDIPPATLYRYLKKMTDDGVLKIVDKKQVRGTIEKTYSIGIDLTNIYSEMLENNSGEAYMATFIQYILGFASHFYNYCNRDDINIVKDKSGFSVTPLYLTDNELESLVKNISELLQTYINNTPTSERKLRSIGLIITPPNKD